MIYLIRNKYSGDIYMICTTKELDIQKTETLSESTYIDEWSLISS